MLNGIPEYYRHRAVRVLTENVSPRTAIRAHCEQCVGWENVKKCVGECKSYGGMLHPFRPYQSKAETADDSDSDETYDQPTADQ